MLGVADSLDPSPIIAYPTLSSARPTALPIRSSLANMPATTQQQMSQEPAPVAFPDGQASTEQPVRFPGEPRRLLPATATATACQAGQSRALQHKTQSETTLPEEFPNLR